MKGSITLFIIMVCFANLALGQGIDKKPNIELRVSDSVIVFQTTKKEVNPELQKVYHSFKNFKIHATQGDFIGLLLEGEYIIYHKEALLVKGNFSKGLKSGIWNQWWLNGKVKQTITWKGGVKNGPFARYDEYGNHLISGTHKNGVYDGVIFRGKNKDIIRTYENGVEKEKEEKPKKSAGKITTYLMKIKTRKKSDQE